METGQERADRTTCNRGIDSVPFTLSGKCYNVTLHRLSEGQAKDPGVSDPRRGRSLQPEICLSDLDSRCMCACK